MLSPSKTRIAYFDNAKLLLIFFVVLGHAMGPLIDHFTALRRIYTWFHFFHMPAFIFIAGYFSHSQTFRPLSAVQNLLIPYLAFQVLYWSFSGQSWSSPELWTTPYFHLWFLISLFTWRLAAGWLIRIPGLLVWACLASLAAGCFDELDKPFSLARTLMFLPFFAAGLIASGRTPPRFGVFWKIAALLFLTGSLALCLSVSFPYRWLFGTYSYHDLNASLIQGMGIRSFILIAGFAASAAFFVLVPSRSFFFTETGRRSLYIYLWHAALVMMAKTIGLYDRISAPWEQALLFPAALAAVFILGSQSWARATQWLVEPFKALAAGRSSRV